MRALCNGKTLAFQAKDAGSIPAARSKISVMIEQSTAQTAIFLQTYELPTIGDFINGQIIENVDVLLI